ncbi:MAG: DUF945 family protein [Lautropia sp.]|nr:DUF945 family protein [Lautropia sp.]
MKNSRLSWVMGGVVAVGLVSAGGSWWLGREIEARHAEAFEKLALQLGANKVEDVQYERGWWRSEARAVAEVLVPADWGLGDGVDGTAQAGQAEAAAAGGDAGEAPLPVSRLRMHVVQDIRHGPLVGGAFGAAVMETRVDRVEGASDWARKAFAGVVSPVLHTQHGFDGAITGQFRWAAGEVTNPDHAADRLAWQPLAYDFTYSGDRKRRTGKLDWPGATWRIESPEKQGQAGLDIQLKGVKAEQALAGSLADQWVLMPGSYWGTVEHFSVQKTGAGAQGLKTVVSLSGWRSEGKVSQEGELLSAEESGQGQGVLMDRPLERLRYAAELKQLDQKAIPVLEALVQQMNQSDGSVQSMPDGNRMVEVMQAVFSGHPSMRFRLEATAEGSTAWAEWQGNFKPLDPQEKNMPAQLRFVRSSDTRFELNLPEPWKPIIEETVKAHAPAELQECLIDCLVGYGALVFRDGAWTMDARFDGTQGLRLNGKALFGKF